MDPVVREALQRLRGYAPEFGPGLSNHGPMVAETLVTLGRGEAVSGYLDRYVPQLEPGPPPGRVLGEEWQDALGQLDRWPDWVAQFESELDEQPVVDVVNQWVPRLAPGVVAAAAHGLIRTAHALRGVGAVGTPGGGTGANPGAEAPEGRREVAEALAYWAAAYQELPGPPLLIGDGGVGDTLQRLPHLPDEAPKDFLISDRLCHVVMIAKPFEQTVSALATPEDVLVGLDGLALGGAAAYLANADRSAVPLVHTVTGPMAVELLVPVLRVQDRATVFAYAWQAVAAIHTAYADERGAPAVPPAVPDPDELITAAVASGDEHAIKLTEACVRAHGRIGESLLLAAAADAAARLHR